MYKPYYKFFIQASCFQLIRLKLSKDIQTIEFVKQSIGYRRVDKLIFLRGMWIA